MKGKQNKSSLFLSENVRLFPQAFEIQGPDYETEFEAVSVPSGTGQAKLLPDILSRIPEPGIGTAVVIPDENLLVPVLNSIPEYVEEIYPVVAKGTMFESIKLIINVVPGLAECNECNEIFNVIEHEGYCPNCGSFEKEILSGKDFLIKEIHVPEDE